MSRNVSGYTDHLQRHCLSAAVAAVIADVLFLDAACLSLGEEGRFKIPSLLALAKKETR